MVVFGALPMTDFLLADPCVPARWKVMSLSDTPLENSLSGARNPDIKDGKDDDDDDDDNEELDETLSERLWGLTEMFPETVRTTAGLTFDFSICAAKKLYSFSRSALWIGTTSFMILVLPVVFETEKLQMEQQQQLQQRQILLGPSTGMSGSLPPLPGKV